MVDMILDAPKFSSRKHHSNALFCESLVGGVFAHLGGGGGGVLLRIPLYLARAAKEQGAN